MTKKDDRSCFSWICSIRKYSLKAEAMDGSFSCKLSDHVIFNFIHACANPVATHKLAQYKLVLELDDKILSLEGR